MRALVALTVSLVVVAGTASTSLATRPDRADPGTGGSARPVDSKGALGRQTFDTSQGQFLANHRNQGWWSPQNRAHDRNDNYIVGRCCGGQHRDFFTFDLSSLSGTVTSATLKIPEGKTRGPRFLDLSFHDVTTPADVLNHNSGRNATIYADLGHGRRYGTFSVPTFAHKPRIRRFQLNRRAIEDINAAAGGYFSVGGSLVQEPGGFLFGSSGDAEKAPRLVVETT